MPSPFPGMDPYLEAPAFWSDCHARLITAISEALNPRLPAPYSAYVQQDVWLVQADGDDQRYEPYVFASTKSSSNGQAAAAALTAPARTRLPTRRRRNRRFLQVINARDRRVVTAVEILSPTNKPGCRDHI